eukprot:TRINITY_DN10376_c0_g2_i1.p1 TRINITY_DN10376_c0_g2~~TRINITY_DN10376_c0_g2_i1.p1  ORF type:complete len:1415 (-),score=266.01 TRINITY_DN10376_c0_g2_i1:44-4288(-)
MQTRPAERSPAAAALEHEDLIRAVRWGEVKVHEGVKLLRLLQSKQHKPRELAPKAEEDATGLESAAALAAGSSTQTLQQEEVILNRVIDSLLEAFRRMTRAEKVGHTWSSERWAAVASVLAKLRSLAATAKWRLAAPATLLSQDARALAETGVDEQATAMQLIDQAEGLVEARVLRIATKLANEDRGDDGRTRQAKLDSVVSPEVRALSRIVLTHIRSVGISLERLTEGDELREVVLPKLAESYSALAAGVTCLKRQMAQAAQKTLQARQEVLQIAAKASCSLGVAKTGSTHRSGPRSDSFIDLHLSTLLATIGSVAEFHDPIPGGPKSENDLRVRRLIDAVLNAPDGAELSTVDIKEAGATTEQGSGLEPWRVEFTSKQLRAMRQAVDTGQPNVAGALALLRDTLNGYASLSDALAASYSSITVLRANPAELGRHKAVVSLVRKLRSVWQDAGALLTPERQADLLALENVKMRHQQLVERGMRTGGHEVAAIVLARLALVDEMMLPPSERRLTGEVPWAFKGPYNSVQTIISSIGQSRRIPSRRRRRWLRCPHAATQLALAGEVFQQLMDRYLSTDVAFEPINACSDIPLSLREFRVAAAFLELRLNERLAGLVYEVAADNAGGTNGEATLYGLQRLILRHGRRGAGEWAIAADAAAAQARAETKSGEEEVQQGSRQGRRASFSALTTVRNAPGLPNKESKERIKATPIVCPRCVRGGMPGFPYCSVGELNRSLAAGGLADVAITSNASTPKSKASGESGFGSSSSEEGSDDAAFQNDPQAGQELGEDVIISWATSVLTDGMLCCKDERGDYFRWLARIVLYDTEVDQDGDESEPMQAPGKGGSANPNNNGKTGGASRRMSFASALSAAIPNFTDDSKPDGSRKLSQADSALISFPDAAQLMLAQPKAGRQKAAQRRQVDEQEELDEAQTDSTLVLPAVYLQSMRVDLSVPAPKEEEVPRNLSKDEWQKAVARKLYSNFHENVDQQKLRRPDREKQLVKELRGLSIQEPDIRMLQKELTAAAELPPNPNGALLLGSAGAVAQRIVIPHMSTRTSVQRGQEQDDKAMLKDAIAWLKESGRGVGGGRAAAEDSVQRTAAEIRESSHRNASNCYGRAGFDEEMQKNSVAVALRLLEHELFNSGSTSGSSAHNAPEEETLERVVPLLLPKKSSNKLLKQARWEEELARAKDGPVERRKARVQEDLVTRDSSPETTDSEDTGSSFNAEFGESGPNKERRKSSDGNLLPVPRGPSAPNSPASRSPTPAKPLSPSASSAVAITQGLGPESKFGNAVVGAYPVFADVRTDLSDWHPSVKALLDSVDQRGERVRGTISGAGFKQKRGFRGGLVRTASDSRLKLLPSVELAATPPRGGVPLSAVKSFKGRKVKRDLVLVEGWRAKIEPESSYGGRSMPRLERG